MTAVAEDTQVLTGGSSDLGLLLDCVGPPKLVTVMFGVGAPLLARPNGEDTVLNIASGDAFTLHWLRV